MISLSLSLSYSYSMLCPPVSLCICVSVSVCHVRLFVFPPLSLNESIYSPKISDRISVRPMSVRTCVYTCIPARTRVRVCNCVRVCAHARVCERMCVCERTELLKWNRCGGVGWRLDGQRLCSQEVCVCVCGCLLYTSPSPRDRGISRMPSSA